MVPDGETVKVGTPLAEIAAEGDGAAPSEEAPAAPEAEAPAAEAPAEAAPAQAEAQAEAEAPPSQEAAAEPAAEPATEPRCRRRRPPPRKRRRHHPIPLRPQPTGSVRMTPAVRRLVREHNIDITQLTRHRRRRPRGRGTTSRVRRRRGARARCSPAWRRVIPPEPATARQHPRQLPHRPLPSLPAQAPAPAAPSCSTPRPRPPSQAPAPLPAPTGGDVEVPLTQMRKGIAAKMTRVKQMVPHAYTVVEVDMHNVVRWREASNAAYKEREGIGLSYVAAVVKAVTEKASAAPDPGTASSPRTRVYPQAGDEIGIAVAVDNGLAGAGHPQRRPAIDQRRQPSYSRTSRLRARINKLKLDEIQGGTFTVNNTGWFGSVLSSAYYGRPGGRHPVHGGDCEWHAREIRAAFAREVRVERVEVQADGAAIHRERRQDVAPPGERDEAKPVALQILDQPPRLPDGALQPVGRRVLREHRTADVHREDEAQRPRLGADLRAAPARTGQGHGCREPGETEDERRPGAARAREPSERGRPPPREPDAAPAAEPGPEAQCQPERRGEQQQERRVEHHGTRTTSVLPSTSSSARAASPRRIRGRVASSYFV